jgi:hypothetical protein
VFGSGQFRDVQRTQYRWRLYSDLMMVAEEVGFEPTESFHPRWFSRPVP